MRVMKYILKVFNEVYELFIMAWRFAFEDDEPIEPYCI